MTPRPAWSGAGDDALPPTVSRASRTSRARVARAVSPPEQVAEVKAIACELPSEHGRPLGRFSRTELHRLVIERGVSEASASTIWRWLHEDAIKPWQIRSWIFPRDPDFARKAGRALDLYGRVFEGTRLRPDEYVICADEKSQLQALGRRHPTVPAGPGRPALVEFEYRRGGTLAYLAAWDVHHAKLFDRVAPKTGIEPFGRLVEQVMTCEPYASARRVFWIVDNGSSHAGRRPSRACASAGRTRTWSTCRSTPPGSTRSSSTSRSSSARRSRPTTSGRSKSSVRGCWPSASTTGGSPGRSRGPSPAVTWTACSPGSPAASPTSGSRPNDRNFRTRLLAAADDPRTGRRRAVGAGLHGPAPAGLRDGGPPRSARSRI